MMANEKRLIDANALKGDFMFLRKMWSGTEILAVIDEAETVDAVEVVHGRWLAEKCDHVRWRLKNPDKWVKYKCSICGYSNGRKHSNYCPNCGAKMDGGDEDG